MTSVSWINETDNSLLLTAAGDGVVRVWGDVMEAGADEGRPPDLVTAFRALPDLEQDPGGPGLATHWQQRRGLLSAAGASRHLNVWDMGSEQMWKQWEVPEQCNVSALRAPSDNSPGPLGGWMIAAGMTDGNVLLYDARERGVSAVHKMMRLRNYVVDLFFPEEGTGHDILTGYSNGSIMTQDIRKASDDKSMPYHCKAQQTAMTCIAMHPRVPVLATGSHKQFINIITPRGDLMSRIKEHTGFFDQRLGCVTALAFHPNKLLLAAGASDPVVSIFAHKEGTSSSTRSACSPASASSSYQRR
ncbi:unnamed protein product [Ectocarpus sp. 13 AM-2016]